jgi:hypothetical protein
MLPPSDISVQNENDGPTIRGILDFDRYSGRLAGDIISKQFGPQTALLIEQFLERKNSSLNEIATDPERVSEILYCLLGIGSDLFIDHLLKGMFSSLNCPSSEFYNRLDLRYGIEKLRDEASSSQSSQKTKR